MIMVTRLPYKDKESLVIGIFKLDSGEIPDKFRRNTWEVNYKK